MRQVDDRETPMAFVAEPLAGTNFMAVHAACLFALKPGSYALWRPGRPHIGMCKHAPLGSNFSTYAAATHNVPTNSS